MNSVLLDVLQRFCFNGRIILGPDSRSLLLTVSLIVVPVILFCAFVSQRLVEQFPRHIGNLIVVLCPLFAVYVSSSSLDDWFFNFPLTLLPGENCQNYM